MSKLHVSQWSECFYFTIKYFAPHKGFAPKILYVQSVCHITLEKWARFVIFIGMCSHTTSKTGMVLFILVFISLASRSSLDYVVTLRCCYTKASIPIDNVESIVVRLKPKWFIFIISSISLSTCSSWSILINYRLCSNALKIIPEFLYLSLLTIMFLEF